MTQVKSTATPAERTLEEHRALSVLLAEIEASASAPAKHGTLTSLLARLREQLAEHFVAEEQAGLFEQIQELEPERAHECARLCSEHSSLLLRLDDLREPGSRGTAGWATAVQAFLRDLERHEGRENEILSLVLDGSVEAQD